MMRLLKYLLIPVFIVGYLFFINSLAAYNPSFGSPVEKTNAPGTEIIGVSDTVTVSVTRPYVFGLIRLPVYNSGFGDVSIFHNIFFNFIFILLAAFIIIDIVQWRRRKWTKSWRRY